MTCPYFLEAPDVRQQQQGLVDAEGQGRVRVQGGGVRVVHGRSAHLVCC